MSDWPHSPPHFDSHITFTNSYLPRLKYVHHNPVHHGILACAENYPWCSASWFARTARPAFRLTVEGFKTDALSVIDDFVPETPSPSAQESGVKPCACPAKCARRIHCDASLMVSA